MISLYTTTNKFDKNRANFFFFSISCPMFDDYYGVKKITISHAIFEVRIRHGIISMRHFFVLKIYMYNKQKIF